MFPYINKLDEMIYIYISMAAGEQRCMQILLFQSINFVADNLMSVRYFFIIVEAVKKSRELCLGKYELGFMLY